MNKAQGSTAYHWFLLFILAALAPNKLWGIDASNTEPWNKRIPHSIDDLLGIQKQLHEQLSEVRETVVSVEAIEGAGSGVIVSPEGLILTAAHVIEERGREMTVVFPDGNKVKAISLGGSELSDAGMLKITEGGPWPHATMALANKSVVGDWCFALGHPSGFDNERGMVLRLGRLIRKKDETIQTDCRLLGGDSGGPLFSLSGEVIGIHSRISQNSDENFHTPIESFLSNWNYFLEEDILTYGSLQGGGFLGVSCEEASKGLEVLELIPGTPAESSGIRPGDFLLRLNDTPLDTREKLTILISRQPPGSMVIIDYLHKGREISVRLTLGERPAKE